MLDEDALREDAEERPELDGVALLEVADAAERDLLLRRRVRPHHADTPHPASQDRKSVNALIKGCPAHTSYGSRNAESANTASAASTSCGLSCCVIHA